ncbi:hypothetical protein FDH01_gp141 [Acinetobacter phage vB_AbaM_ME3]|uniref:Uncharacterized protein n=1 Tax=Acinetobacter phage vB_AbaM_ME3 TaxID=1837876 RepID=A0A172Q0U9_9CAUD|nr:hypothetical protein FDH01_gp141 [Acinetobacter phage vB_AbaM_ME3]AND75481.1 hypothetical protein ME3_320 [Acinetobacter phage vB_AbaM_ME3]
MLENLVEVDSFVKLPVAPSVVFTLYKELVQVFSDKWDVLNSKERIAIASSLNLNVKYLTRVLKDSDKSLSIAQLFKLCYFFNHDLILTKGKEKIVFSITDPKFVNDHIVRLNKILFEIIKPVPTNHLAYLSKIQHLSLYNLKDVYITRRNFVRYMRLLVNFDVSFHLIPKVKVTQMYKEVKNVA